MVESRGPLAPLRAVDVTATRGAYAARLFADLGAEVTRVQFCDDDTAAPLGSELDPAWTFQNLSKTVVVIDDDEVGRAQLEALIADADILVTDGSPADLSRRGLDNAASRHPRLVHLSVSPWGLTGPHADRPATDLTLLAAGGLLSLGGDPDRPPVRAYPEQSSMAASLHGAVGALIGLIARDGLEAGAGSGRGQLVDVSAQEAVAHSLENAAQYVDLENVVRTRTGSRPSEAGSGLYRCVDGLVYLVTGIGGIPLAWAGLVRWLRDEGSTDLADELDQPRWQDTTWRRTAAATVDFRTLFERFARDRTKVELCEEGQAHGVSISPVSTPADLLANEQLMARGFFTPVTMLDGTALPVAGAPYRFADTQVGPRPIRMAGPTADQPMAPSATAAS